MNWNDAPKCPSCGRAMQIAKPLCNDCVQHLARIKENEVEINKRVDAEIDSNMGGWN